MPHKQLENENELGNSKWGHYLEIPETVYYAATTCRHKLDHQTYSIRTAEGGQ